MSALSRYIRRQQELLQKLDKIKMRAHLNADAMYAAIRRDFGVVPDQRAGNSQIPMVDALMSGFAMFSLKAPSLLAFDKQRCEEPEYLHSVFGVEVIPCDSQMRTILDEVVPERLRRPFRSVFHQLQRGKVLPQMTCLGGHLLLGVDGTGFYSSEELGSDYCLTKKKRNGSVEYHLQMLAGAFVHPDRREVIPVCPEMIRRQDGSNKNDCERNAAKRFLADLRREHPHLKIVIVEDGLSSNAPHIKDLARHNLRYIISAKPGDHQFLFEFVDAADQAGQVTNLILPHPDHKDRCRCFRFINDVPLNQASRDELQVNFLEYWETEDGADGEEPRIINRFSWVTDLEITTENVVELMRCGRARWRIENETFNTLKNQGYNLGHNYGLGKKHLSAVFTQLMMLAFLVDQVQQLACPLFQMAREKRGSKARLWEAIRGILLCFEVSSMESILRAIVMGVRGKMPALE